MPGFEGGGVPDERAVIREKLKKTILSLDQIAALSIDNPEMKTTLEKAVAVALARFGSEDVSDIVEAWPDAVIANGRVDIVASLYKRIKEHGISGMQDIPNSVTLTAMDIMKGAEPTSVGSQLEKLFV